MRNVFHNKKALCSVALAMTLNGSAYLSTMPTAMAASPQYATKLLVLTSFMKALGIQGEPSGKNPFSDVPSSDWGLVRSAIIKGLVTPNSHTHFGASDKVTIGMVDQMYWTAAGINSADAPYEAGQVPYNWAEYIGLNRGLQGKYMTPRDVSQMAANLVDLTQGYYLSGGVYHVLYQPVNYYRDAFKDSGMAIQGQQNALTTTYDVMNHVTVWKQGGYIYASVPTFKAADTDTYAMDVNAAQVSTNGGKTWVSTNTTGPVNVNTNLSSHVTIRTADTSALAITLQWVNQDGFSTWLGGFVVTDGAGRIQMNYQGENPEGGWGPGFALHLSDKPSLDPSSYATKTTSGTTTTNHATTQAKNPQTSKQTTPTTKASQSTNGKQIYLKITNTPNSNGSSTGSSESNNGPFSIELVDQNGNPVSASQNINISSQLALQMMNVSSQDGFMLEKSLASRLTDSTLNMVTIPKGQSSVDNLYVGSDSQGILAPQGFKVALLSQVFPQAVTNIHATTDSEGQQTVSWNTAPDDLNGASEYYVFANAGSGWQQINMVPYQTWPGTKQAGQELSDYHGTVQVDIRTIDPVGNSIDAMATIHLK